MTGVQTCALPIYQIFLEQAATSLDRTLAQCNFNRLNNQFKLALQTSSARNDDYVEHISLGPSSLSFMELFQAVNTGQIPNVSVDVNMPQTD